MDDQLDVLATDKFGIKFPRDKISYVQMTAGMPGHTIWRYYKELITEITSKIDIVYRSCLRDDLSFPEGKLLYDVLEDTLRILWTQNEEVRKERASKRLDGKNPFLFGRCRGRKEKKKMSLLPSPIPLLPLSSR